MISDQDVSRLWCDFTSADRDLSLILVIFPQLGAVQNESLLWTLADGNSSAISNDCPAVRVNNGSIVIENTTCSNELPFICQRGMWIISSFHV